MGWTFAPGKFIVLSGSGLGPIHRPLEGLSMPPATFQRVLFIPPFTEMIWPVMYRDPSPSMKMMRGTRSREGLPNRRSEEHTSELQSLMRISYAVFALKKKTQNNDINDYHI